MLAYGGQGAEARAALERRLRLIDRRPRQRDYILLNAARIETILGNKERAIDYLEEIRKTGGILTPQFLARCDPTFASLKGNPRFEKLLGK